ncbi:MAG: M48 family metalloprotease, partial [Nitrospirota bacterium]
MLNRSSRGLFVVGLVLLATAGLTGCAEIQKAAEGAARNSGNERLAKTIHGGGTLIGGLLPIGYEEEQTIGQAIALQVVARYGGIYDQPDLTRYVNLIGRSVALTCDRADIEYRFAILNHDSINAFAAPAGYIFVTRGLLKTIKNEAELAAVLGHEIGHVTQKHILDVIQRSKQIAGVAEA